jgi:hypothetical protein
MSNTEFTPAQLAQIAQILSAVNAAQTKGGTARKSKADLLSAKDKALVAGFSRKGFKDVVLMDRTDPTKPFNVRPFNGWISQGRIVRKGERGVRGLFHISQTEPVTAAPKEPKTEPKTMADRAVATAGGFTAKTLADLAAAMKAKGAVVTAEGVKA